MSHLGDLLAFGRRLWRLASRGKIRISRTTVKVPSQLFKKYLQRKLLGQLSAIKRTGWRRQVVSTLSDWHSGRVSHQVATESLESVLGGLDLSRASSEDLILTSRFAMSLGLFDASFAFYKAGCHALNQSAPKFDSVAFRIARLKQSLYFGKIDDAHHLFESLRSSPWRGSASSSLETLGWYIRCCLNRAVLGRRSRSSSSRVQVAWNEIVSGRDVLIVGPGETRDLPELRPGYLVARVIGPGVYEWKDENDIASNRVDAVYTIPENILRYAMEQSSDLRDKLSSYRFVNIKRKDVLGASNSRPVETFWQLYSSGHPQMVPLMVLDVLAQGGRPVVVGSDFFQSPVAYRFSERRRIRNRVQALSGSDGGDFDRSALMASHNVFENWAIIKNLVSAGLVGGDERFLSSCLLSSERLAHRYDEVIGQHRI